MEQGQTKKELLFFIPGLGMRARGGDQLTGFVAGLIGASRGEFIKGSVTHCIQRIRSSEPGVEIDIREAYWRDLAPSMTKQRIDRTLIRGLSLAIYWIFSPVWRGFLSRKYLTLGIVFSFVAYLLWYSSLLILALDSLVSHPPEFLAKTLDAIAELFPKGWAWLLKFGALPFWAATSALVGIVEAAVLVDISDFAKRYISREKREGGEIPVQDEILARVRGEFKAAMSTHEYSRVTVVAHSFGSVIGVNLLAESSVTGKFRLVTLGSPIALLAARENRLAQDVRSVAFNDNIEWVDVKAPADWLGAGSTFERIKEDEFKRCRSVEVDFSGTFVDRLAARHHDEYFGNPDAVSEILELPKPHRVSIDSARA